MGLGVRVGVGVRLRGGVRVGLGLEADLEVSLARREVAQLLQHRLLLDQLVLAHDHLRLLLERRHRHLVRVRVGVRFEVGPFTLSRT